MNSEIKIIDLNQLIPIHTFWDRMKFHGANQTETESTSEWLQRLNTLAKPCCYGGDTNAFLIERFILGLREKTLNQLLLTVEKYKKYLTFKDIFEFAEGFQRDDPSCGVKDEGESTSWIKEETNHVENSQNDVMPEIVYCEAVEANLVNCDSRINEFTKSLARNSTKISSKKEEQDLKVNETKLDLEHIPCAPNVEDIANSELLVPCGVRIRTKSGRRPRPKRGTIKSPKRAAPAPKERQENQLVAVNIDNTSNPGTSNQIKAFRKSQPVKKLECDYCHSKWLYKKQLIRHMWIHTTSERPFMCQHCGKQFYDVQFLTMHLRTHTGERPFECKLCDKTFAQQSKLYRHQLTHTGIKKFKCTICGKAFAQKYNLTLHYPIHTDEKPFNCHICGKGYNQSRSLKTHIKNHSKLDV